MNNSVPFFTIGIPVYNMSKWVGECLDSVLSQGFTDFEIICVDDGSKDNSLEILNSYASKDSRIKVIHRANGGVSTARNCIFCYAQGQYIFTIDSDDIMCEDVLQQAYDAILKENYPDILQTSYSNLRNGVEAFVYRPYPGDKYFLPSISKDERTIMLWLDRSFMPFGSTRFVRKNFIYDNGIMFSQRYTVLEDSAYAFELYRKADTIAYAPFKSFLYCLTRDDVTSKRSPYKAIKSIITRWKDFYNDIDNWQLSAETRQRVEQERISFIEEYRDKCLMIANENVDKEEFFKIVHLYDDTLGKEIKKLPLPKNKNAIIFMLFKIIGIPNTMKLLYFYLEKKVL